MSGHDFRALSLVGTVIAIIAGGAIVAVALLGLAHAREEARAKRCLSILSRYGTAFAAYAEDYGHVLPYENVGDEQHGRVVWSEALTAYMDEADRLCPSVDRSVENHREGYRINSKLSRRSADPPQPYRPLNSLLSRPRTVVLFDAEYGGRKQVITSATKRVRSYDYETGRLIWECRGLGTNAIPAPVIHNGVVFVMTGHRSPNLLAIRLGGEGDITHSEFVLWSSTKGNAYTPSPLLYGNILYVLSDRGFISAYNAMTGKPYYQQQRLPKSYTFKSSLVGANGKLYLSSEDGDVIVLKMGETYEVLATNTLAGQSFIATPAIVDGAMLLRSETGLFCIREQN
ncbi:MAG: PQQ-binding-like beta-propeller repeat protein [Planctomycetes bacterium]|nr:PQQ-binding-like beta-propeller repeat protein [Planctomycetota bacterium]